MKNHLSKLPHLSASVIAATLLIAATSQAQTQAQLASTLRVGTNLEPGASIRSPDGRTVLVMQTDGNLVLYFEPGGEYPTNYTVLWASGTEGHPGALAWVDPLNGALFVMDPHGAALWSSPGTGNNSTNNALLVTDDGRFMLGVWQTTQQPWGLPPLTGFVDLWDTPLSYGVGLPPANYCDANSGFCPLGSWWQSCDAPIGMQCNQDRSRFGVSITCSAGSAKACTEWQVIIPGECGGSDTNLGSVTNVANNFGRQGPNSNAMTSCTNESGTLSCNNGNLGTSGECIN